jgi:xanthine dehydrogenase accessory factor
MNRADDILKFTAARKSSAEPFALATVVRTVAATAAKAGAKAVILPDGTISEGWIGGGCVRAAVLKAACDAVADGKITLEEIAISVPAEIVAVRRGKLRSDPRGVPVVNGFNWRLTLRA